jgi:hypothetical protein
VVEMHVARCRLRLRVTYEFADHRQSHSGATLAKL